MTKYLLCVDGDYSVEEEDSDNLTRFVGAEAIKTNPTYYEFSSKLADGVHCVKILKLDEDNEEEAELLEERHIETEQNLDKFMEAHMQ